MYNWIYNLNSTYNKHILLKSPWIYQCTYIFIYNKACIALIFVDIVWEIQAISLYLFLIFFSIIIFVIECIHLWITRVYYSQPLGCCTLKTLLILGMWQIEYGIMNMGVNNTKSVYINKLSTCCAVLLESMNSISSSRAFEIPTIGRQYRMLYNSYLKYVLRIKLFARCLLQNGTQHF